MRPVAQLGYLNKPGGAQLGYLNKPGGSLGTLEWVPLTLISSSMTMANPSDRDLDMGRPITRRDFLNGVGLALTGSLAYPWFEALEDNSVSDNSVSVHHYCFLCIKSVGWIHGKTSKTDRR